MAGHRGRGGHTVPEVHPIKLEVHEGEGNMLYAELCRPDEDCFRPPPSQSVQPIAGQQGERDYYRLYGTTANQIRTDFFKWAIKHCTPPSLLVQFLSSVGAIPETTSPSDGKRLRKELLQALNCHYTFMSIYKDDIGRIIGRDGHHIFAFQQLSSASMYIPSKPKPGESEVELAIVASHSAPVNYCSALVRMVLTPISLGGVKPDDQKASSSGQSQDPPPVYRVIHMCDHEYKHLLQEVKKAGNSVQSVLTANATQMFWYGRIPGTHAYQIVLVGPACTTTVEEISQLLARRDRHGKIKKPALLEIADMLHYQPQIVVSLSNPHGCWPADMSAGSIISNGRQPVPQPPFMSPNLPPSPAFFPIQLSGMIPPNAFPAMPVMNAPMNSPMDRPGAPLPMTIRMPIEPSSAFSVASSPSLMGQAVTPYTRKEGALRNKADSGTTTTPSQIDATSTSNYSSQVQHRIDSFNDNQQDTHLHRQEYQPQHQQQQYFTSSPGNVYSQPPLHPTVPIPMPMPMPMSLQLSSPLQTHQAYPQHTVAAPPSLSSPGFSPSLALQSIPQPPYPFFPASPSSISYNNASSEQQTSPFGQPITKHSVGTLNQQAPQSNLPQLMYMSPPLSHVPLSPLLETRLIHHYELLSAHVRDLTGAELHWQQGADHIAVMAPYEILNMVVHYLHELPLPPVTSQSTNHPNYFQYPHQYHYNKHIQEDASASATTSISTVTAADSENKLSPVVSSSTFEIPACRQPLTSVILGNTGDHRCPITDSGQCSTTRGQRTANETKQSTPPSLVPISVAMSVASANRPISPSYTWKSSTCTNDGATVCQDNGPQSKTSSQVETFTSPSVSSWEQHKSTTLASDFQNMSLSSQSKAMSTN